MIKDIRDHERPNPPGLKLLKKQFQLRMEKQDLLSDVKTFSKNLLIMEGLSFMLIDTGVVIGLHT